MTRSRALLLLAVALAAALRLPFLSTPFSHSDHAELAWRVLSHDGIAWIVQQPYGVMCLIVAKLSVALSSWFDVAITERTWRAPVALIAIAQVPVAYALLRRRHTDHTDRVWLAVAASTMAVFPAHIGWSRFAWGYELMGLLCITLVLHTTIAFLRAPSRRAAVSCSLALALYLTSHGNLAPLVIALPIALAVFGPDGMGRTRLLGALRLGAKHHVWVAPLIVAPLLIAPLVHMAQHERHIGFHALDQAVYFARNLGAPLLALIVVGAAATAVWRDRLAIVLFGAGLAYLAPFVLASPFGGDWPQLYFMLGQALLVLGAASQLVAVPAAPARASVIVRQVARAFLAFVVLTSAAGVVLMHSRDDEHVAGARALAFGPLSKGSIKDPGTKSVAALIRTAASRSPSAPWNILALDRAIEPPNAGYYFARDANMNVLSFYDSPRDAAPTLFAQHADGSDVVICDPDQASLLDAQPAFRRVASVSEHGKARMLIYARTQLEFPSEGDVDVDVGNARFDAAFPLLASE